MLKMRLCATDKIIEKGPEKIVYFKICSESQSWKEHDLLAPNIFSLLQVNMKLKLLWTAKSLELGHL